ncbi:hypothetical protein [Streptacidiphilus sp. EB129]|uniref:hypothetical protein n=1 Tax=Streptacidiphilus sp. EB129 TaxID=3156262 RepID=UPI003516C010
MNAAAAPEAAHAARPVRTDRAVRAGEPRRQSLAELAGDGVLPAAIRERVLPSSGDQVAVLAFQSSI